MSKDEIAEFLDESREAKTRLIDVISDLVERFGLTDVEALMAIRNSVVKNAVLETEIA